MLTVEKFNRNKAFINRNPSDLTPTVSTANLTPGGGIFMTGRAGGGIYQTGMNIPFKGIVGSGEKSDMLIAQPKGKSSALAVKYPKPPGFYNKRKIQKIAMIAKGGSIAATILTPLLTSGIQALTPYVIKGISKAANWFINLFKKKKKGRGKKILAHPDEIVGRRNYMKYKGAGKRIRKIIDFFKKKGLPAVLKLAKRLVGNEELMGQFISNKDHLGTIMKVLDLGEEIASPLFKPKKDPIAQAMAVAEMSKQMVEQEGKKRSKKPVKDIPLDLGESSGPITDTLEKMAKEAATSIDKGNGVKKIHLKIDRKKK